MITRFGRSVVRPVTLFMLPVLSMAFIETRSFSMPEDTPGDPVKNLRIVAETDSLVILYDLDAQGGEGWEIGVVLVRSGDPSYKHTPRNLKGDIGPIRGSRTNLRIVWDFGKEMLAPPGDDYQVRVTFDRLGGGFPWLWVGGGAVVAGVVAYLLLKDDTPEDLPWPPPR
jgi:hypothetical protein